jgi:hypothetical protein
VRKLFGFVSNSSTRLVGDNPGQPGAALRQLRAPGQGAIPSRGTCRRTTPPLADISGAPDMERALAKRVNYRGSNIFRFGPTENFERGNKIKRARTEHDSELYPLPSLPGSVCVFRVRLVLLPNSVTSAILRLYHQLGSSG